MNQLRLTKKPVVLCFSGHDPSGGAGIQADIEAIVAQGAYATTVVTLLTVQDTSSLSQLLPLDAQWIEQQAAAILADLDVKVIKLGALGSVAAIEVIANVLKAHPQLPVVIDPVLSSGGGSALSREDLINGYRDLLVPLASVITPNWPEACALADCDGSLEQVADTLLAMGTKQLLISGGHGPDEPLVNRLFSADGVVQQNQWPRYPGQFHGTGCTLASAIAGQLAMGQEMAQAVANAEAYTARCVATALAVGSSHVPNRVVN